MCFRDRLIILFLSAALVLPLACRQPSDVVLVTEVIDGDTIVIEGGHHVRYIGIDAPESGELYYSEAKQANEDLVAGKKIRLGYVYVDDDFLNAEMVRQGYAWAVAYPPDVKYQVYLKSIEKEARQAKRGVWR